MRKERERSQRLEREKKKKEEELRIAQQKYYEERQKQLTLEHIERAKKEEEIYGKYADAYERIKEGWDRGTIKRNAPSGVYVDGLNEIMMDLGLTEREIYTIYHSPPSMGLSD